MLGRLKWRRESATLSPLAGAEECGCEIRPLETQLYEFSGLIPSENPSTGPSRLMLLQLKCSLHPFFSSPALEFKSKTLMEFAV